MSEPLQLPVPIGTIVAGRYKITGLLGQGGMGVVFAGLHIALGERVAIKFLLRDNAAHAARFFREARAAAKIRSEHVVRIIDVGRMKRDGSEDEGSGDPYIVMEHLEGEDLAGRLAREGTMSPTKVADILVDVCEALAEAHAAGIVHRDLKPANIFLAKAPDGEDLVKLLDFGIAKVPEADSLTKTMAVLGSPLYMSPEQLMGSRNVDARADLWSLGIIVYELLSGDMPFTGESLIHLGFLVREQPTPDIRHKRPDVPEGLRALIERCLAKERNDRLPDVGAFAALIAPFTSADASQQVTKIKRVLARAQEASDAALTETGEAISGEPTSSLPGPNAFTPNPSSPRTPSTQELAATSETPSGPDDGPSAAGLAKSNPSSESSAAPRNLRFGARIALAGAAFVGLMGTGWAIATASKQAMTATANAPALLPSLAPSSSAPTTHGDAAITRSSAEPSGPLPVASSAQPARPIALVSTHAPPPKASATGVSSTHPTAPHPAIPPNCTVPFEMVNGVKIPKLGCQ